MVKIWRIHKSGFGLPKNGTWQDQDPDIMECLLEMQEYYDYNYSHVADIRKLLYSKIVPYMKAGFRIKD